jgi:hypothetical protein
MLQEYLYFHLRSPSAQNKFRFRGDRRDLALNVELRYTSATDILVTGPVAVHGTDLQTTASVRQQQLAQADIFAYSNQSNIMRKTTLPNKIKIEEAYTEL